MENNLVMKNNLTSCGGATPYFDSLFLLNKVFKNRDVSIEILLKAYGGDGVGIYESGMWWLLEYNQIYPLKNGYETWKLFSGKNFVYGLNKLVEHNVPIDSENDDLAASTKYYFILDEAAKHSAFDSLLWLYRHNKKAFVESEIVELVGGVDNEKSLEIIKWLYYSAYEGSSKEDIEYYFAEGLCSAASSGSLNVLKFLCNLFPSEKQNAFRHALMSGNTKNSRWLLKSGCLITTENISYAVYGGDLEFLKDLLVLRPRNVTVTLPNEVDLYKVSGSGRKLKKEKRKKCMVYLKQMGF